MSFQKVKTGVFDRSGTDVVSSRTFFTVLGLTLSYGFILTSIIAVQCAPMFLHGINWLTLIIVGLLLPILGCIIAVKSDNPVISFLGYNLVVCPFGVILAPILNIYHIEVIQHAFFITAIDVIVMSVAAVTFPSFFSKLGPILFVCLLGLIIALIVQMFLPIHLSIIDWIGALLFSLYVGYDWWRANEVPKTIDNAIDLALDLYLDIINLFLFILELVGKKD
jgi:FtsH-binding integral membrane protein